MSEQETNEMDYMPADLMDRINKLVDKKLFGDAWSNERFGGFTDGEDHYSQILNALNRAMSNKIPVVLSSGDVRALLIGISNTVSEANICRKSMRSSSERYKTIKRKYTELLKQNKEM